MAGRTKTRATQSANGRVAEEEIATKEHDALLRWLIDNLGGVVTDELYGKGQGWIDDEAVKARQSAKARWTSFASALTDYSAPGSTLAGDGFDEVAVSDEGRALFAEGSTLLNRWAADMKFAAPTSDVGEAKLVSYEVMKPVHRLEERANSTKRVAAGFVDVAAVILEPRSLILQEYEGADEERGSIDPELDSERSTRRRVELVQSGKVGWWTCHDEVTVWFRVRTRPFTLGEILQDLKAMQSLESGDHAVALCVPKIDDVTREHIEHEGFAVIAAADFEEQ